MLLKVNDEYVNRFVRLEEILDDSVGQSAKMLVQRGSEEFECSIKVGDKHCITPDRYVSVCGAKFNTLSYQLARAYNVPVKGIYVSEQSGASFTSFVDFRIISIRRGEWLNFGKRRSPASANT
jgi:pro-apoptotic serine protease NMA111